MLGHPPHASAFDNPDIVDGYWPRRASLPWLRALDSPCRRAPKGHLVDVGCGSGAYGRALCSRHGFQGPILVDSSREVTRRLAEGTAPGEIVLQSDLCSWPPPPNGASVVLLKSVVHHAADREAAIAANACRLGPGGALIVQTRSREQFLAGTELEFYLPTFAELWTALSVRYPPLDEIQAQMSAQRLFVERFDYTDVFSIAAELHLRRLSLRQGNSVLHALAPDQLAQVLAEATRRYATTPHLTFLVPMTILIGWCARR